MWVTNVRTEEQGLIVEDLVEEVVSTTHRVMDMIMLDGVLKKTTRNTGTLKHMHFTVDLTLQHK